MTTPSDGRPPTDSGLPPHLDPRGTRRPSVPRVAPAGPTGPPPRRTGKRRAGRIMSWIALTMSVLILGLAGVGYVLVQHYDGNITRLGGVLEGITGGKKPPKAPKNAQNILLVGSDSRAGANGIGTGGERLTAGQRSDTIILAHLYGKSDNALFVSFPRDSYVEIPAWTDKDGKTHRSRHGRVNSALSEGGPALLIATIERLTDIRVDHYVQVDFTGFKNMVNKLGGVDVCLTKAARDTKSGINLSAGRHHINGATALAFVRQRQGLAAGDLGRIKRQQQLLGSMVNKVLSSGTLLNPFKLNGFLNAATSSLVVDDQMSFSDMKNIALRMRDFSSGGVLFATVPVADANERINGMSVVRLDDTAARAMFASLRQDQAPGTAPKPGSSAAPTTGPVIKPNAIQVRVYNGSGVAGVARKAFNALSEAGFATTGTPTNRGAGATVTTIFHGPSKADSARVLASWIPGAVTQEDPALRRTLEVVVGSDYNGVSAPGTAPSQAAPNKPAPKPTIPPGIRTAKDDICSSA